MRQVYFDPFGKYVEGYDQGAQRQLGTEKAIREARDQDYEYRVNAPLRSQVLGSQARVDTAIEPYRVSVAQANATRAQQEAATGGLGLGSDLSYMSQSAVPAIANMATAMGATPRFNSDGSVSFIGAHGEEMMRGDPAQILAHSTATKQAATELAGSQAGYYKAHAEQVGGLNAERMDAAELRFRGLKYAADGRLMAAGMRDNSAQGTGFDPFNGGGQTNDFTNPGGFGAPAQQPQAQPAAQPAVLPSQPQAQQTLDDSYNLQNSFGANNKHRPRPVNSIIDDTAPLDEYGQAKKPPKQRPANQYNV